MILNLQQNVIINHMWLFPNSLLYIFNLYLKDLDLWSYDFDIPDRHHTALVLCCNQTGVLEEQGCDTVTGGLKDGKHLLHEGMIVPRGWIDKISSDCSRE